MNIRSILLVITLFMLSLSVKAEIKVKHYNHKDGLNEYVYDIRQDRYDRRFIDIEAIWQLRGRMWEQKGRTKEMFLANPTKFIERWRAGWSQMPAGTYDGYVDLVFDEKKVTCSFVAPEVDKPQTIHILLEAFDMAIPRLTSYQRYIITVIPVKK